MLRPHEYATRLIASVAFFVNTVSPTVECVNRATRDPYAGSAEDLRERLRGLTDEVQRNELLLRKTQAREIELLRAHSLGELFDRIVSGLRDAYAALGWPGGAFPWRGSDADRRG